MTKDEKKEIVLSIVIVQIIMYWLVVLIYWSDLFVFESLESKGGNFIGFDARWLWFFLPSFISFIFYRFSR